MPTPGTSGWTNSQPRGPSLGPHPRSWHASSTVLELPSTPWAAASPPPTPRSSAPPYEPASPETPMGGYAVLRTATFLATSTIGDEASPSMENRRDAQRGHAPRGARGQFGRGSHRHSGHQRDPARRRPALATPPCRTRPNGRRPRSSRPARPRRRAWNHCGGGPRCRRRGLEPGRRTTGRRQSSWNADLGSERAA